MPDMLTPPASAVGGSNPQTQEQQAQPQAAPPGLPSVAQDPRLALALAQLNPAPPSGLHQGLAAILPALGAMMSMRNGGTGLGSFMKGWQGQEESQAKIANEQAQTTDRRAALLHQMYQEQHAATMAQLAAAHQADREKQQDRQWQMSEQRLQAAEDWRQLQDQHKIYAEKEKDWKEYWKENQAALSSLQRTQGPQAFAGMQINLAGQNYPAGQVLDDHLSKDPKTGRYEALNGGIDNSKFFKILDADTKARTVRRLAADKIDPQTVDEPTLMAYAQKAGKAGLAGEDLKQKIQIYNMQQKAPITFTDWAQSPAKPAPGPEADKYDTRLGGSQNQIYAMAQMASVMGIREAIAGFGLGQVRDVRQMREAVGLKMASILNAAGVTWPDAKAEYANLTATQRRALPGFVQKSANSNAALDYAALAKQESHQFTRTDIPFVNDVMNKVMQMAGDPQLPGLTKFEVYIYAYARDYAKTVTAGQNLSSAALTDSAQKEVTKLFNAAQTPAQFDAALDASTTEMRANVAEQGKAIARFSPNIGRLMAGETIDTLVEPPPPAPNPGKPGWTWGQPR